MLDENVSQTADGGRLLTAPSVGLSMPTLVASSRVTRIGQGRSGGYRTPSAYRVEERAVFLYGFAKRERENIDPDELLTLREIGAAWLAAEAARIAQALKEDALQEVPHDDRETQSTDGGLAGDG